jgi:ribosomal subunit interface protein
MLPVQITIRDIPGAHNGSRNLEDHIRTKSESLKKYYNNMTSCRIVVEYEQKHKHRGKLYNIRIDITVPGKELVTTKKSNEDVYVAIRDAFNAINRQLDNLSHKRHGRVKTHSIVMHGRVARILEEDGFGFIEGTDGNEYYFSVTNVKSPGFERLMIGDAVEYYPEPVNEGWQACHIIRERHQTETR